MSPSQHCQACGAARLREIAGFRQLPRVTSDSKPFRPGGRLFVCEDCGLVQKIADADWLRETAEIYRDYEMYHQSAANDQPVFDPVSGRPSGRCEVLTRRLLESGALAASGALLDVGAGSGAMLGAFSAASRGWTLFGLDLDDRKQPALSAIPRFERLFTVPIGQLPRRFDLITLIHSLEHFAEPLSTLRALREKIAPGGRLFIEVNNVDRQPFDLVVADHLCHFTPRSLAYLVARAGFGVESPRSDWVNKEISLIAVAEPGQATTDPEDAPAAIGRAQSEVAWLNGMLADARTRAQGARFGIFGTSVAATWLATSLGDVVEFFVDEDPAREGRAHLGRPILKPSRAPHGAVVYLAFAREAADAIRDRLANLPVTFAAPPAAAV